MPRTRTSSASTSGSGSTGLLTIIRKTHGGAIFRSAIFLCLSLTVAGGLLATMPVARYYAVAQYEYSRFGYEVSGRLDSTSLSALRAMASQGQEASFLMVRPGSLRAGPTTVSGITLLLADSRSDLAASWFTPATLVASTPVQGEWVDLSITLADQLGVGPGDRLTIPLTSGSVQGKVRSVYALAFNGETTFAIAGRTTLVDQLLPGAIGTSTIATLATTASRADVESAATGKAALPGKSPVRAVVRSLDEARIEASQAAPTRGSAVRTLELLGLLLFVALAVREGHVLVTRRADTLAVAVAVGARRRTVVGALLAWECLAALLVGLGCWWAIRDIAFGSFLPFVWPPRLDSTLATWLTLTMSAYLSTVAIVGLSQFSYARLLATLRDGQSL